MQRGVETARGEWLLFTDADVYFAPGALRRAIAIVLHQGADHLTLIPRTIQNGFWLKVAVRAFGLLLISLMLLRAGVQCVRNDGIDWRGAQYPLKQLRAGQRVKFFKLPFRK